MILEKKIKSQFSKDVWRGVSHDAGRTVVVYTLSLSQGFSNPIKPCLRTAEISRLKEALEGDSQLACQSPFPQVVLDLLVPPGGFSIRCIVQNPYQGLMRWPRVYVTSCSEIWMKPEKMLEGGGVFFSCYGEKEFFIVYSHKRSRAINFWSYQVKNSRYLREVLSLNMHMELSRPVAREKFVWSHKEIW